MKRRRPGAHGGALGFALAAVVSAAGVAALTACGSGKDSGVASAKLPEGVRDESIDHQSCSESGNRVEQLDANNDSKFDVKIIYAGQSNTKMCLISDLNHDGKPDMYEYYDKEGALRRREADYDANGTIDSIEDYELGRLVERQLDTTGQQRIDTWEFYDSTGKLVRRERDSTNDGRIDQWAIFDGQHQTIAFDKDGDGQPDPVDAVVLNLDGTPVDDAADAAAPAPAATGDAGATASATPTLAAPMDETLDAGASGKRGTDGKKKKDSSKSEKTPKKLITKDGGK